MTKDEILKQYPSNQYHHIRGITSYSGFQDKIEKTPYEIIAKKTKTVVKTFIHTQVHEGMDITEDYWS